jgi:uncharacterized protein with HEPN domain
MSSQPRKWKFRLRHMQEAIEKIQRYTVGVTREEFGSGEKVDAVVWNLTVLGEAARQIPDSIVQAYPEVPWPQMRGIRNRIVHGYDQIDVDIIWNVVQNELAPIAEQLYRIMAEAVE